MFVDFAGRTMEVVDGIGGKVCRAEIFVAVLGASSFTYAWATWSQSVAECIGAHVAVFKYFGGVVRQVVSDDLKAGVTRACFHDPAVNRTYGGWPRMTAPRPCRSCPADRDQRDLRRNYVQRAGERRTNEQNGGGDQADQTGVAVRRQPRKLNRIFTN